MYKETTPAMFWLDVNSGRMLALHCHGVPPGLHGDAMRNLHIQIYNPQFALSRRS
jgi:hypothetical protein